MLRQGRVRCTGWPHNAYRLSRAHRLWGSQVTAAGRHAGCMRRRVGLSSSFRPPLACAGSLAATQYVTCVLRWSCSGSRREPCACQSGCVTRHASLACARSPRGPHSGRSRTAQATRWATPCDATVRAWTRIRVSRPPPLASRLQLAAVTGWYTMMSAHAHYMCAVIADQTSVEYGTVLEPRLPKVQGRVGSCQRKDQGEQESVVH